MILIFYYQLHSEVPMGRYVPLCRITQHCGALLKPKPRYQAFLMGNLSPSCFC